MDIVTEHSPKVGRRHMRMRGWSSVKRTVNLSGPSDARVSFWAKTDSLESGDEVSAEVSKDGESWTTLESWTKDEQHSDYRHYDYDLSKEGYDRQLSLRFRSKTNEPTDYFFLDGVRVGAESVDADDPPADDDIPEPPPVLQPPPTQDIVIDGKFEDWDGYPQMDDPQGDAKRARGDLSLLQWANNGGSEVNYWMIERYPNEPNSRYDDDDDKWRSWNKKHNFNDKNHGRKVKYTIYIDTDDDGKFNERDDRRVTVEYLPRVWNSSVEVKVKAGRRGHTIYSASGDWGESIAEGGRRVELTVPFEHLGVTSGEVIRMYVESDWDDRLPNSGDIQWSPASVLGYTLLAALLGVASIAFWRIKVRREAA